MAKHKNKSRSGQLGCRFIAISAIVLVVMLFANMIFVRAFFSANLPGIDDRIFQAAQFVMPIVLIFIEFWVYDLIFNRRKLPRLDDES